MLLLIALLPALAQAEKAPTPHQLIERLGVLTRLALEAPRHSAGPSVDDVERGVAERLRTWSARHPGDDALARADASGRTPLMLAVGGAHVPVVQALLADPAVRAGLGARNSAGETAWAIAATAPALTLPACEPATLTLERQPLMEPYLRRAARLMENQHAPLRRSVALLESAGAVREPDAARQAWLARCPGAHPATRERLVGGTLPDTLLADATDRMQGFYKLLAGAAARVPTDVPSGRRLVPADAAALALPERPVSQLPCTTQPVPQMGGALNWGGHLTLTTRAVTRAGIVERVDIDTPPDADPIAAAYFRRLVIRALAGYRCEGDAVFTQTFAFRVE